MNVLHELRRRVSDALSPLVAADQLSELAGMVQPSQDPKFGDYQLGDWGTQFGMIIYGYKQNPQLRKSIAESADLTEKIGQLGTLYQSISRLADEDVRVREQVLAETARLHEGDPENVRIWNE